jgi:hypothetical protein
MMRICSAAKLRAGLNASSGEPDSHVSKSAGSEIKTKAYVDTETVKMGARVL